MAINTINLPYKNCLSMWPDDVGILALEIYFPKQCVSQKDLEKHDGADEGKYTIGLGQNHMGFCNDIEDIHSLSLTVLHNLLDNYIVSPCEIGRLEVGTETLIDKSKSCKSVLMQLFHECGNNNIEGVDTINACYGGTQALFNALSWIESSAWDGRYAIVIAADIAIYACGNARPTGGAGAVAMLIGPNAPLVIDRGIRSTYMEHAYDFYKPILNSEYPIVDGKHSIMCYMRSLDKCYSRFKDIFMSKYHAQFSLDSADFFLFHSPYTKLVQKSVARLMFIDFISENTPDTSSNGKYMGLEAFSQRKLEDTYDDRDLFDNFKSASKHIFSSKTDPTLIVAKEVGNIYTGSLYGGLVSLLASKSSEELTGSRLILFSYGSGLASSMFSIICQSNSNNDFSLNKLVSHFATLHDHLLKRTLIPPMDFDSVLKLREKTHNQAPYLPQYDSTNLFPGTYYLLKCDDRYRRFYQRVPNIK